MGSGHSKKHYGDEGTLAETVFNQQELKRMRKTYYKEHPSGTISRKEFIDAYSQFFPFSDPSEIAGHIFNAIDREQKDYIVFHQYVDALAVTQRGSDEQKMRFAFEVYDINGDGVISRTEYEEIQSALELLVHPAYRRSPRCSLSSSQPTLGIASQLKAASCGNLTAMHIDLRPNMTSGYATPPRHSVAEVRVRTKNGSSGTPPMTQRKSSTQISGLRRESYFSSQASLSSPVQQRRSQLGGLRRDSCLGSQTSLSGPTHDRPRLSTGTPPALHLTRHEGGSNRLTVGEVCERRPSRLSPLLPQSCSPSSNALRRPVLYASDLERNQAPSIDSPTAYSDSSSEASSTLSRNSERSSSPPLFGSEDHDDEDDVFSLMDMNADGFIDFDEFMAGVKRDASLLRFLQFNKAR